MKNYKQEWYYHMRFKFIFLLFFSICISLVAISCKSALYLPNETHIGKEVSLKELNTGRCLYVNKCASCHTLYLPTKYNSQVWKQKMDEMSSKAKLDVTEYNLVLKYLQVGANTQL